MSQYARGDNRSNGQEAKKRPPDIPPRPIIICTRCRRPFDAKREMPKEWYDSFRCESCGKLNNPSRILCEREYIEPGIPNFDRAGRCVYIVKAGDKMVKIGITSKLEKRMAQLRTGSPLEIELLESYRVEDAAVFEKKLHEELSALNDHGEWFTLTDRSLEDFISAVDLLASEYQAAD